MESDEAKGLQTQIDLMSKVLVTLVTAAQLDMKIKRRTHLAAQELAKSADPAVAKAAAEWGAKWFPYQPFMDDPMNQ